MIRMRRTGLLLPAFFAVCLLGDVSTCKCDPSKPEMMEARECGLCREAEKQPAGVPYFFLKDSNPRKSNRTLVLPRKHYPAGHGIDHMPPNERLELWTLAIKKAKELWGDDWGVAYNGDQVRTQCHGHIHIGKFLKVTETTRGNPFTISSPSQIPLSRGKGIWVHPVGGKMHVHWGEQICETVLLR